MEITRALATGRRLLREHGRDDAHREHDRRDDCHRRVPEAPCDVAVPGGAHARRDRRTGRFPAHRDSPFSACSAATRACAHTIAFQSARST